MDIDGNADFNLIPLLLAFWRINLGRTDPWIVSGFGEKRKTSSDSPKIQKPKKQEEKEPVLHCTLIVHIQLS